MAAILTPEDVVRRIAAECTFIDERRAVGVRLEPAAASAPAAVGQTAASTVILRVSFDHIFCNT